MEGMNDEAKRELRALRERAYGPAADIDTDAAATARLAELEALLHPAPEPEPVIDIDPEPAPEPEDDPFAEMCLANDDAEPSPPTPPRLSKRMKMWWVASVAVAVILAVVITAFVSRRVQADPQEVAVLSVNPLAEWPSEMFGLQDGAGRIYTPFHGLVAVETAGYVSPSESTDRCVNIMSEAALDGARNGSMNGPWYGGCGAGVFPATAQFVVGEGPELPEELRDAYPDGTALQFQLIGDEVIVLAHLPEDGAT